MKIGLFGYGKMGQLIARLAAEQGHTVVATIDEAPTEIPYDQMDVAIDFSVPEAAYENIKRCLEQGVPVVSGTTGWLDRKAEIEDVCKQQGGAFLYASNFSLGMNLFFRLNRELTRLIDVHHHYRVRIHETHHSEKLDAPSGTAIRLAKDLQANSGYSGWSMDSKDPNMISVTSTREGQVPGRHEIIWEGPDDAISITHTAHNRMAFASGALLAAAWLIGKKGVFGMQDVLESP